MKLPIFNYWFAVRETYRARSKFAGVAIYALYPLLWLRGIGMSMVAVLRLHRYMGGES